MSGCCSFEWTANQIIYCNSSTKTRPLHTHTTIEIWWHLLTFFQMKRSLLFYGLPSVQLFWFRNFNFLHFQCPPRSWIQTLSCVSVFWRKMSTVFLFLSLFLWCTYVFTVYIQKTHKMVQKIWKYIVLWRFHSCTMKKPCRSFPKVLEHRKWLQHLVADALFRRSKTDYLSVESNQRFRSLSMGTSPCTTLRVEAGIRAPSFGGGCAPSAAPPVPFLSTFN